MANVTFTSPKMAKDLTVYATAGDCHTLLSVAKAHKVPIDFECENGGGMSLTSASSICCLLIFPENRRTVFSFSVR